MKNNINITTAKIVKGVTCAIKFKSVKDDGTHFLTDESESPVHGDLLNAFKRLVPHMIVIGEFSSIANHEFMLTEEALLELSENEREAISEELAAFTCTGLHIQKDQESIILVGNKKLQTGKVFNFVLPMLLLNENYPYTELLLEEITNVCKEVLLYMDGKSAQQTLFPNQEEPISKIEEIKEDAQKLIDKNNEKSKFEYSELPEKPLGKVKPFVAPKRKKPVVNKKKNPFEKVG